MDDEAWASQYIEVATRNWWPGKKVLVSPAWIERVSSSAACTLVWNLCSSVTAATPSWPSFLVSIRIPSHRNGKESGSCLRHDSQLATVRSKLIAQGNFHDARIESASDLSKGAASEGRCYGVEIRVIEDVKGFGFGAREKLPISARLE